MAAGTGSTAAGDDDARCESAPGVDANIADLVTSAARRDPSHPAVIEADAGLRREVSWGQLDAAVTAEARRLRTFGLSPGDRVALALPAGAALCVALFATLRAGCVAVPLSDSLPAAELKRTLDDSGARVLVAADSAGTCDTAGELGMAVMQPPELGAEPSAAEPSFASPTSGPDLAILAYTSGTSGPPRGAMLSHRALLSNAAQCAQLRPMPVNAADRVLVALPLFHSYGLGPGLLQVTRAGATAVLMPRFDAERALAAIAELRVTVLVGVPSMYKALLRLCGQRLREEMSTLRLLTSGAAALEAETAAALQAATGLEVFEGYGLTETGPVVTTTLAGGHAKPGSVGRPLPGVEVRLVDADGEPLAGEDAADTGRVCVRGPNLFSGYWPDGRHGPDGDGWFRTGDVGYLDADGDLHLVDRATDLIIVNGFNVYPHEVEQVLLELDGIAEAAVIGVPDEITGETVRAVLVQRPGTALAAEDVVAHCAAKLAKFKVPTRIDFADALPHSPTGKVARRKLRNEMIRGA